MLKPWRRHVSSCPHRAGSYLKCKCPLWVMGTQEGKFIRRSLDTRNLERAAQRIREIELGKGRGRAVLLSEAWDRFVAAREAKGSAEETMKKLKRLRVQMESSFGAR